MGDNKGESSRKNEDILSKALTESHSQEVETPEVDADLIENYTHLLDRFQEERCAKEMALAKQSELKAQVECQSNLAARVSKLKEVIILKDSQIEDLSLQSRLNRQLMSYTENLKDNLKKYEHLCRYILDGRERFEKRLQECNDLLKAGSSRELIS